MLPAIKYLAEYKAKHHLGYGELARTFDIDVGNLHVLLNKGRDEIHASTACKISHVLGIPVEELIGFKWRGEEVKTQS